MNKKKFKIIGFIPAKKNSRDLKNKNFKKLNNLSLFEISLLSSIHSKLINQTFLSSNSDFILNKAKHYGAIQVKRNEKFCKFNTTANEVILDFIKNNLPKNEYKDYVIVYLQPTSPFRNHNHVDKAINLFFKKKYKILVSVEKNKNFFKSFKLKQNHLKPYFQNKLITTNRQELSNIYSPNGAIYIFYVKDFLLHKKINFINAGKFIMNKIESIDIDSQEDFIMANHLSKKYINYKK